MIPQIIARIASPVAPVRVLINELLCSIGKVHPQACVVFRFRFGCLTNVIWFLVRHWCIRWLLHRNRTREHVSRPPKRSWSRCVYIGSILSSVLTIDIWSNLIWFCCFLVQHWSIRRCLSRTVRLIWIDIVSHSFFGSFDCCRIDQSVDIVARNVAWRTRRSIARTIPPF